MSQARAGQYVKEKNPSLAKRENDAERGCRLERNGFRVVRFWNGEVLNNSDDVLERIRLALRERGVMRPHV